MRIQPHRACPDGEEDGCSLPTVRLPGSKPLGTPPAAHIHADSPVALYHKGMNKAFVREPDDLAGAQCPRCGSLGIAVSGETLNAQLSPNERRNLPESA